MVMNRERGTQRARQINKAILPQVKKRGMPSPDSADAMALTFSEPEGLPIPRSIATNFNRVIHYPKLGIV
jgi:hypothetical protein